MTAVPGGFGFGPEPETSTVRTAASRGPVIRRRRSLRIFPQVMFVCCLRPRARTRISRGFIAKQLSEGGGKLKERPATSARKFVGRALSKAEGWGGACVNLRCSSIRLVASPFAPHALFPSRYTRGRDTIEAL